MPKLYHNYADYQDPFICGYPIHILLPITKTPKDAKANCKASTETYQEDIEVRKCSGERPEVIYRAAQLHGNLSYCDGQADGQIHTFSAALTFSRPSYSLLKTDRNTCERVRLPLKLSPGLVFHTSFPKNVTLYHIMKH